MVTADASNKYILYLQLLQLLVLKSAVLINTQIPVKIFNIEEYQEKYRLYCIWPSTVFIKFSFQNEGAITVTWKWEVLMLTGLWTYNKLIKNSNPIKNSPLSKITFQTSPWIKLENFIYWTGEQLKKMCCFSNAVKCIMEE